MESVSDADVDGDQRPAKHARLADDLLSLPEPNWDDAQLRAWARAAVRERVTGVMLEELQMDMIQCEACGSGDDEHVLVLCDICSRGFHTYCLVPALQSVPEGARVSCLLLLLSLPPHRRLDVPCLYGPQRH